MKLNKRLLLILLFFLLGLIIIGNFVFWQERQFFSLKLKNQRPIIAKNILLNEDNLDSSLITIKEGQIENKIENEIKNEALIEESEKIEPIKLLFFGDVMLDRHVGEKISRYGLDSLFSKIEETSFTEGYDLVSLNLEGAVTNEGQHYKPDNLYDFAFKPQIVAELKKYNFNFFNLANNHLSDQGKRGVEETYQNLSDLGFYYSGCQDAYLSPATSSSQIILGENLPALDYNNCSDIILNIKNKKIAFLGISLVYKEIAENDILNRVKSLKERSDLVIVNIHFGNEYQGQSNNRQKTLARKMVDEGADIIIGHHPHVIQDYEVYQGKPIFYSLGNFIFDQYFSAETQEGLAVQIILTENKFEDNSNIEIKTEVYKIKTKGSKIEEIHKDL